jgi:hypothetical protein
MKGSGDLPLNHSQFFRWKKLEETGPEKAVT